MSKIRPGSEVVIATMSVDSAGDHFGDAQQRFLRHFLAGEREVFRTVAVIVPNVEDARDVVQQVALVLWERFAEYDPARPFTPWACRFAVNIARQWVDRHRRWKAVLDGGLADELVRRRDELLAEMDVRFRHLEHCMGRLPDDQRQLVAGYYQGRVTVEALARETGRSVEAVYKALQRTRAALRDCIERAARKSTGET
jgi:RNA polymerase sigma-70 factor (ECF subfamily)